MKRPAAPLGRPHRTPFVLALALCACVTARAPKRSEDLADVRPTLEEIFLLPGLQGEAPRLRSLAPDGRVALVDWRSTETDAAGARSWARNLSPYWIDTRAEPTVLGAANSLAVVAQDLFRSSEAAAGGETKEATRLRLQTWSPTGHRLAVATSDAIAIVDWNERMQPSARLVYSDPKKDARDASGDELPRIGGITGLEFSDGGATLEVRGGGELYRLRLEDESAWPVTLTAENCTTRDIAAPLGRIERSRDGTRVFSKDGKLVADKTRANEHFHDFATGRGVVLEGLADLGRVEGLDLSPCGEWVFGFEVDASGRPKPTLIPDYLTERVTTREARADLADDEWPARKAWIWSTRDGSKRALELPGNARTPMGAIGWAPEGEPRFALRRTSEDYRAVETWIWSAAGPRLALVERDEHWVGGPGAFARWNREGTRILLASEGAPFSTTPGRNQLFELDPASGELRQRTAVEGEVSQWLTSEQGALLICASREDPARRELGVVEERGVRWLPLPAGMNTGARVSSDGSTVLFEHEELGLPSELWCVPFDGSTPARRLTSTIPIAYSQHDWILPEKLQVHSADGSDVRAHVYSPRGSTLSKPREARPCIVFIHGAGYLQNVTDSMTEYAVNLMFHSRLAEQGFVVADVDYRGSAGYGAKFRGDVQFQLGKLELEDIAAVIDELARRGAVDPARVACYGGSYGGFLTLMALFTQPERWAGGAALRSVTDWRTYHPGYTQPRLGRPSTHPDAYAESSPIDHAQKLQDPLLILHGMVDSNVFAQDSIRLMEKLIDLGLDFDAMLYPSQDHAFEDGPHWVDEYRRIERFLVRALEAK